jgi:hypothetical protein
MNMLEKLIELNARLDEYSRVLTRTREERDIIHKCLKISLQALGDIVNKGLTGDEARERVEIAMDAIEVLCS